MFAKTLSYQIFGPDQDTLANLLDRFRYFIKCGPQLLDVFPFERSNKRFGKLLGQFLRDPFILTPAVGELFQVFRCVVLLEFLQQADQVVNACVRLLRTGFEQIVKLLIPPDQLLNRKHGRSVGTRPCRLLQRQNFVRPHQVERLVPKPLTMARAIALGTTRFTRCARGIARAGLTRPENST